MTFTIYLLGIVSGLISATIILLAGLYLKPKIERKLNQVASVIKEKGSIHIDDNEELNEWVENLPKE